MKENEMIYITEDESAEAATHELAYDAVRAAFMATAGDGTVAFPVVLGHAGDPQNRFTIKSSTDERLTGLKVGSYYPTNDAVGLPRHSSITLLFDHSKGRIGAIVEGAKLNAFRTAAADAVATDALAREDAETLAVFGTGHQAEYEVIAVARIRTLTKVFVVGRNAEKVDAFVGRLRGQGIKAEAASAEAACRSADIIIAATTATAPLFDADWVKPGTHISSMGSDRTGKQELPPSLFARASLFCDLAEQSRVIGEFQHADATLELATIGAVLAGKAPGRTHQDQITIFDSSGISLQDLYMAQALIDLRR
jgi:ornithine cyclodeaminase